jgi:hypothetical protein
MYLSMYVFASCCDRESAVDSEFRKTERKSSIEDVFTYKDFASFSR